MTVVVVALVALNALTERAKKPVIRIGLEEASA